jgi:hypothetical protein
MEERRVLSMGVRGGGRKPGGAAPVFSNRKMSLKEAKGRRSRVFVLSGF